MSQRRRELLVEGWHQWAALEIQSKGIPVLGCQELVERPSPYHSSWAPLAQPLNHLPFFFSWHYWCEQGSISAMASCPDLLTLPEPHCHSVPEWVRRVGGD